MNAAYFTATFAASFSLQPALTSAYTHFIQHSDSLFMCASERQKDKEENREGERTVEYGCIVFNCMREYAQNNAALPVTLSHLFILFTFIFSYVE